MFVFAPLTLFASFFVLVSPLTDRSPMPISSVTTAPHKSEPYRIRLMVGGDRLDCIDDTSSPAAPLLETKLLLNSTISDAHLGLAS